jgi:mannose-6-phosphate isomerase-like protein (cupin superfamily)
MIREERTVRYDNELGIEAYRFKGIMLKFPNHFHEYYVIGFIEAGRRHLSCKNREYTIGDGDMILFNPLDNHTCEQTDGKTLDYRCLNIQPEVMRKTILEITGADGDDELRFGHLVVDPFETVLDLLGHRSGRDEDVGVAGCSLQDDAEAFHIVARGQRGDDLDIAGVAGAGVEMDDPG